MTSPQTGRVYLVGAGPGDPGLITLRGAQCLARADVVLYDYLANQQLLEHARPGAECICLGRHGRDRIVPQSEVNRLMIDAARGGKTVVRLKGGDPVVFARAAEEIEALRAANIPLEIVPGITAALAAGSHAGIPITHRAHASAVALVTGHEQDEKASSAIDFAALARFPGTLVFYMGVTTAEAWTRQLVDAGKPADTPAAIIRRCSWPDQEMHRATLGTVAETIKQKHLRPPVIVLVGDVVPESTADWFTERPLFGRRVLITRPAHQQGPLRQLLHEQGAEVLEQPAIEISPPDDWRPLDAALRQLDQYDWLVFSSANGVRSALERLHAHHGDVRRLGSVRIAAIGPGTAEELANWRLKADLLPESFRAEGLAAALLGEASAQPGRPLRYLLVRASRGREALADDLARAGGAVDQVVAYRSSDAAAPDAEIAEQMAAGQIDWVTVTSSAIARSLAAMFGQSLGRCRLASISPITTATLAELGYQSSAEAKVYTMQGVVEAIVEAIVAAEK